LGLELALGLDKPSTPRSARAAMQKSSSARAGRRAAVLLPAAALLALLACSAHLSSNAFVAPGSGAAAPSRRGALGSLLPAVLAAVPLAAGAEESSRVVRPLEGGGKVSFQMPPDAKDWVANTKVTELEAVFDRKDGAFIAVGPVPPGYVEARLNYEDGPGNGFRLEKYEKGVKQDDLVWNKDGTIYKGAQGGGALIGGFLFQDGDWTAYKQWIRVLHGPKGDVVLNMAVPQEKIGAEGPKLEAVLNSFRIEA